MLSYGNGKLPSPKLPTPHFPVPEGPSNVQNSGLLGLVRGFGRLAYILLGSRQLQMVDSQKLKHRCRMIYASCLSCRASSRRQYSLGSKCIAYRG